MRRVKVYGCPAIFPYFFAIFSSYYICFNALSLGEGLIKTDGTVWDLFGGKLHLFYTERGRHRWLNGNWKAYKVQADKTWADLH